MTSLAGAAVLVAGVGNIFQRDDGFGVEVVRLLASEELPEDVSVRDFGIRGVHLAYELLEGYRALILIDAVSRGDLVGTVTVIQPEPPPLRGEGTLAAMDAHGLHPEAVLAMVRDLGGHLEHVVVVGCEVGDVSEGIGLSPAVAAAVPGAARVVRDLVPSLGTAGASLGSSGPATGQARSDVQKREVLA